MNALICVDYQYDFVADDGKLTVGQLARDIESVIYEQIEKYLENGEMVIVTLDNHFSEQWENHPESKNFILHCENKTTGYRLYGKLEKYMEDSRVIKLEKNGYVPKYDNIAKIIRNIDTVEIVGVVTHICVLQIAIFIYNIAIELGKNLKIIINQKGCASFDQQNHKYALDYMKNVLNCEII